MGRFMSESEAIVGGPQSVGRSQPGRTGVRCDESVKEDSERRSKEEEENTELSSHKREKREKKKVNLDDMQSWQGHDLVAERLSHGGGGGRSTVSTVHRRLQALTGGFRDIPGTIQASEVADSTRDCPTAAQKGSSFTWEWLPSRHAQTASCG